MYEKLAARLGQKDGYQCLRSQKEVGEAICIALELIEELEQKKDTETVFGTTFSVAMAKSGNRVFGQIVFLRQTGMAPRPQ